MDDFINNVADLHFWQALIIVIGIFLSDIIVGIIAAVSSKRHVKSQIMSACQDRKMQTFFKYIIMGVCFHLAAVLGGAIGANETKMLSTIATIVVIIPALPEIISIFENFRIIKTKTDTKPKE